MYVCKIEGKHVKKGDVVAVNTKMGNKWVGKRIKVLQVYTGEIYGSMMDDAPGGYTKGIRIYMITRNLVWPHNGLTDYLRSIVGIS